MSSSSNDGHLRQPASNPPPSGGGRPPGSIAPFPPAVMSPIVDPRLLRQMVVSNHHALVAAHRQQRQKVMAQHHQQQPHQPQHQKVVHQPYQQQHHHQQHPQQHHQQHHLHHQYSPNQHQQHYPPQVTAQQWHQYPQHQQQHPHHHQQQHLHQQQQQQQQLQHLHQQQQGQPIMHSHDHGGAPQHAQHSQAQRQPSRPAAPPPTTTTTASSQTQFIVPPHPPPPPRSRSRSSSSSSGGGGQGGEGEEGGNVATTTSPSAQSAEALRTYALMRYLGVLPNAADPTTAVVNQQQTAAAASPRGPGRKSTAGSSSSGGGSAAAAPPPPPPEVDGVGRDDDDDDDDGEIARKARAYGEENRQFYDSLVNMLGKEEADRVVREAIDETYEEEGMASGGGGGGSSSSSAAVEAATTTTATTTMTTNARGGKRKATAETTGGAYRGGREVISVHNSDSEEEADDAGGGAFDAGEEEGGEKVSGGTTTRPPAAAASTPPAKGRGSRPPAIMPPGTPTPSEWVSPAKKSSPKTTAAAVASASPLNTSQNNPNKRKTYYATAIDQKNGSKRIRFDSTTRTATEAQVPNPLASGAARDAHRRRDPPGFDEFKADPEFCLMILRAVDKYKSEHRSLAVGQSAVSLFVQGLLNISDDLLIKPLGEKSAPSMRAFVKNVICPYFNVPSHLVSKEEPWEAYVNICSENIHRFARNILYQRRKSMKSATQLAMSLQNNRDNLGDEVKNISDGGNEKDIKQLREDNKRLQLEMTRKDERIKELDADFAKTIKKFSHKVSSLKKNHELEMKECETKYTGFVKDLIKSHRKETDDLRKEMKSMRNVHRTFIESYVEASVDMLRKNDCDTPTL